MEDVTRNILEKMDEKMRMDTINNEIEKRQKRLMAEGIYPHTLSWVLGKTLILRDIGREFNINWQLTKEEKLKDRIRVWFVDTLIKYKIVNSLFAVKLLDRFMKMPRALFPRWVYIQDGLKLQMDDGDKEMQPILKDYTYLKIWEPETTKIVKENVKEGDTCIDIGASIGIFTLQFARLVGPKGHVYSFEPTEMNYDYMCQNIELNGFQEQCLPFKLGAWHKYQVVRLPRCAAKPFWSNGVPVAHFLKNTIGVEHVDFIKVDVDGSEPNVFEGLIPIFEKNPKLKMVVEYYPKYIKDAGLEPQKMKDIINKYFTYTVIPGDYAGDCENWFCIHK